MKQASKSFAALTAATVIVVIAAGFSTTTRNGYQPPEGAGGKALPGLVKAINDVQTISVQHPRGNLTIKRYPDRWVLAEKGDYPVRADAVRKVLLGLAQLELSEAKTRSKDLHGHLNLRDVEAEGAKSRKVTLKDKDGKLISELLVGKSTLGLEGRRGVYVRKPGDVQTWLAKGALDLGVEPSSWLQTPIASISPKRVARVLIRHPDGEAFAASKATPGDPHFTIDNLPSKTELKSLSAADTLASALDSLELDDVAKADTVTFAEDKTITAEIATFDGLVVTVDVVEIDGRNWIKLSAAFVEGGGEEQDAKAAKQAADFNARTQGWAFQVAAYKVVDLKKRLINLIDTNLHE